MKLKPSKRLLLIFSYLLVGFLVVVAVKAFTGPTQNPSGGNPSWPKINSVVGTTDISTASTTYYGMEDMTYTDTFAAENVLILFKASIYLKNPYYVYCGLYIDDVLVDTTRLATRHDNQSGGEWTGDQDAMITHTATLSAGPHTIKVKWKVTGSTFNQYGTITPRKLTIIRGLN